MGTTIFVDKHHPSCSDSGAGSAVQPYCSIVKAGTAATAGATVLVAAGTYSGMVTVANSGTSTDPITFTPAPGAGVTVTGGANGFKLTNRSYVVIDGFTVTNTTSHGFNVSGGAYVTISGNTVTSAGTPTSGQIGAGIKLSGTTDSTISGNVTEYNSDHGIYLASGTTRVTVVRNSSNHNARGYQRNANGIDVIGPGNSVIDNVTHDNEDSGIQFYTGGDNGLAVNNVAYNNGDHGIDNLNVIGGRIIANTIYRNCTSGINVEGSSGSFVVANNVAFDNAVYPAYNGISCDRRAGNIGIWDSAPPSTTVNHNLVWLTTTGKQYVWAGSTYNTLAGLQNASGQESAGIYGDPKVVSPATWDLQLTSTSPAIDAANSSASGARSTDILGRPRVDHPDKANSGSGTRLYDDRGAYEFQTGPPPPAPPNAALSASPAAGVVPVAVTANASASTPGDAPISTYTFDFGDGTIVGPQAGSSASHTYTTAGSYTLTVTVTDQDGLTDIAAKTISAQPSGTPPTAAVSLNQSSGPAPLAVTADASASTPGSSPISTYAFDFGDGTVVGPQAGSSASHSYTTAGSYTLTVTVTDGAGGTDDVTAGVTVTAGGGAELVANPGFETGTTGWKVTPSGSTTLTRVAGGHSGGYAGEAVNATGGTVSCTLNDSPNWAATTQAGTVTGSAWVKAAAPGQAIKLKLTEYSGSSSLGSSSSTLTLGTEWQRISVSYAVTSPGSTIDFILYISSAPSGQCFLADDLSLLHTPGSPLKAVTRQPGSSVGGTG
ncbi:PKD domain-containing protein [Nonomuraea sp. NPDC046570]|uniref:PKD domain-containing protein n=1 Tax=Nonomuraea sp. NPDC046570 TaxID=3155255 RepID=UPI0033C08A10